MKNKLLIAILVIFVVFSSNIGIGFAAFEFNGAVDKFLQGAAMAIAPPDGFGIKIRVTFDANGGKFSGSATPSIVELVPDRTGTAKLEFPPEPPAIGTGILPYGAKLTIVWTAEPTNASAQKYEEDLLVEHDITLYAHYTVEHGDIKYIYINEHPYSLASKNSFEVTEATNFEVIQYGCAVIPNQLMGLGVTYIKDNAFENYPNSVSLEDATNLIAIGSYAFANVGKEIETNFNFPELILIGERAFFNSTFFPIDGYNGNTVEVSLGKLRFIENYAFYNHKMVNANLIVTLNPEATVGSYQNKNPASEYGITFIKSAG